ncbi:MAG: methyltransferase domain-containing protein [Alphaproteobacteria bacterium]|nr:methyltransferase domain-containing protein [Alphaproteobacteria bacterium]
MNDTDTLSPPTEAHLRAALAAEPDSPERHLALAEFLHKASHFEEAEALARRAVALAPQMIRAYAGLSASLSQQKKYDEAAAILEGALATYPDRPVLWYNLAGIRSLQTRYPQAEEAMHTAIRLQPGRPEVHRQFSAIFLAQGKKVRAINQCRAALRLAPDNPQWWKDLFLLWMQVAYIPPDDFLEQDLLKILTFEGTYPRNIGTTVQMLLKERPEFKTLIAQAVQGAPLALSNTAVQQALSNALFLSFIAKERVTLPALEHLLRSLRRALLLHAATQPLGGHLLPFLCALAEQCFFSEYIYPESAEETAAITRLLAQKTLPKEAVMLLAAYGPLHQFPDATGLLDRPDLSLHSAIDAVLTHQIREPLEELAIRAAIPSLTPITDSTSRKVQAQYEENPYPRWKQQMQFRPLPLRTYMEMLFPYLKHEPTAFPDAPRILVAGCGTGKQPIETVGRIANADVTAFDISRTSLAYAIRKQRELGIQSLRFAQGDIMEAATLTERFDVIICSGVLHHMHDPVAGWKALLSRLADGGLMSIGLYSEIARKHIVAARAFIAEQGFSATAEDIRACRDRIFALPDDHPAKPASQSADFYTLSSCRDLIFHVQEHRFTIPQLKKILDELQLEFLGFDFPTFAPVERYREAFPDDPHATSLDNWHAYEAANPYLFASMYQFWVRRRG